MLSRTLRAAPIRALRPVAVRPARRAYATGGDDPAEFKANTHKVDRSNTMMFLIGGFSFVIATIYFMGVSRPDHAAEVAVKADPGAVDHIGPQGVYGKDTNYRPRPDIKGK